MIHRLFLFGTEIVIVQFQFKYMWFVSHGCMLFTLLLSSWYFCLKFFLFLFSRRIRSNTFLDGFTLAPNRYNEKCLRQVNTIFPFRWSQEYVIFPNPHALPIWRT
jgi:hypothetical protein